MLKTTSMTLPSVAMSLALAIGCGGEARRGGGGGGGSGDGGGDGADPGDGGGSEGEGESDELPPPPDLGDCDIPTLEADLPARVEVDTTEAEGNWRSACTDGQGAGGPDLAWVFTAPEGGRYSFSTIGSDYDTVISLREPACGGAELHCNDDVQEGNQQSWLVVDLQPGESLVVVADGYDGESAGALRLSVKRAEVHCDDGEDDDGDDVADCDDTDCARAPNCLGGDCPGTTLESAIPLRAEGVAQGGAPSFVSGASCGEGGGAGPEVTFGFTAPVDGPYVIHTLGSNFDTLLYVRDGSCTGPELGCDDDGGAERTSRLRLDLRAGQQIMVVVDSLRPRGGDVLLAIEGVEVDCGDGLDDDQDGLVDCEDDDCLSIECATGGAWPEDWARSEVLMLEEVNRRRARGAMCANDRFGPAPPLEMDEHLRLSARLHSLDMGNQDYFEHDGLDGRTPFDRMADAGFRGAGPMGENIQAGSASAMDATESLMSSPPHCRNIMNPEYRVLGTGHAFVAGSGYGDYWTQNFGGSH